ncbi:MAG: hypothetical protein IKH27_12485 [Oscillospiraceae bacterium]|nr:hypothetical protein [Oscillospiraceae bacterium]MBR3448611.1 hypothetical protein [Oscillospiraceae bacterium]
MFLNNNAKPLPDGLKCLKCPYYLGQIKCIVSPCRECIMSKRKTHPFVHLKSERKSEK